MDNFMNGPLLKWLRTFSEVPSDVTFQDLISRNILHQILRTFENELPKIYEEDSSTLDYKSKVNNLERLILLLKYFYEELLGQIIIMPLPDVLTLCHEPPNEDSIFQMDRLLLLFLGAAVQCSQKEKMIASITNLSEDIQMSFVSKIQEVSNNPENIWPSESMNPCLLEETTKNNNYRLLLSHLRRLVKERDDFAHKIVEISIVHSRETEEESLITSESSHHAIQLSELKAKIRKLNQTLEEKTEGFAELKEESDKMSSLLHKLRQENLSLTQESRNSKGLIDELDILREKATKVDRLEGDIQRYKDRVSDIEFYKARIEEYSEDNKILSETKNMLESQLESARKRTSSLLALETEVLHLKSENEDLSLQRDKDSEKISELLEENKALSLHLQSSSATASSTTSKTSLDNKNASMAEETFGKDVSLIHRLELENQKLMSELENVKFSEFYAISDRVLQLERENKKLGMTIKGLEDRLFVEETEVLSLEKELLHLRSKNKNYESEISFLKESNESMILEKEAEIEGYEKTIGSLRKREEQSQNEQIVLLGEENQKLSQEKSQLQSIISSLEKKLRIQFQDSQLTIRECEKDRDDKYKECQKTIESLQERNKSIVSEVEKLKYERDELIVRQDSERLEQKNERLEIEKKLQMVTHEINESQRDFESRKRCFEVESEKLKLSFVTSQRQLEESKSLIENLEVKVSHGASENSRLSRQNESLSLRLEEGISENGRLERENSKLEDSISHLKVIARKVETLEKDNVFLESENHRIVHTNKTLSNEIERAKRSIEMQDATLDEFSSKVNALSKEKMALLLELEKWNENSNRLLSLEKENSTLSQTVAVDKRTLFTLREQLIAEKLKGDSLESEIKSLFSALQKCGLTKEILLSNESVNLLSNERIVELEQSFSSLMKNKDRKIESLEFRIAELLNHQNFEMNGQRNFKNKEKEDEEESKDEDDEKKVDIISTNQKMNSQNKSVFNKQVQVSSSHLEYLVESLTKDKEYIQKQLMELSSEKTGLQVGNTVLQVENTTLQSQSTSLLQQINDLQQNLVILESEKEKFLTNDKKYKDNLENLLKDQSKLQSLHDNLQLDYEKLLTERDHYRETDKTLKSELLDFKKRSILLDERENEILRAKESLELQREKLRSDSRTLLNLRNEHARLKDDFRSLFTSNEKLKNEMCNLQSDYKTLKTLSNTYKLSQTRLLGDMEELKHTNAHYEIENSKLSNKVEVLNRLNDSLEEDRKSLNAQVEILLTQYHELLNKTLRDKDSFHEEEKWYTDKVHSLARQKEKLEQKIFEQYQRMDNNTPKKSGFRSQLVQRMRKASSNLRLRPSARSLGIPLPSVPTTRSHSFDGSRRLRPLPILEDDAVDSSSLGSNGNESLDSGQHSPDNSSGAQKTTLDSDGNQGDNDSVNSTASVETHGTYFGEEGRGVDDTVEHESELEQNISFSSFSDVGIPIRSESRETTQSSRHSSWNENDGAPPLVPRKQSVDEAPPKRPPKPTSTPETPELNGISKNGGGGSTSSSTSKKNEEWYEYGCV